MRKIIAGVLAVSLIALLLIGILMVELYLLFVRNPITANFPDYEDAECYYGEGFQDYVDYCKYYYPKDSGVAESLEENKYFRLVSAYDVEKIRGYFEDFERWVKFEEYRDRYDFQCEWIDTSDYFYIESADAYGYDIYFFDIQTCILYFIHVNL